MILPVETQTATAHARQGVSGNRSLKFGRNIDRNTRSSKPFIIHFTPPFVKPKALWVCVCVGGLQYIKP